MASRASAYWATLQPREKRALVLLGAVFIMVVASVVTYLRMQHSDALRKEIEAHRQALDMIAVRGKTVLEAEKTRKARESSISSQPVLFNTLLERASTVATDISVANQEEQPAIEAGPGLRRRTVEFELRKVTLDSLTKFLAQLEKDPRHTIRTTRLQIRAHHPDKDELNVEAELSSWERVEADAAEEGKAEK